MNDIELNTIITNAYNFAHKGKGKFKKNIYTIRYATLFSLNLDGYITDDQMVEILYFFIIKRREYFINLLNENQTNFIYISDLLDKHPEVMPVITNSYIMKHHNNFIQYIINNSENISFDSLPKCLSDVKEIQDLYDRKKRVYIHDKFDKNGYDYNWLNKDGKIIHFFSLLAEFPITSKQDYLKLAEEYKKSEMSINEFCNKYGISSVEGFKKMLNRIKDESNLAKEELEKVSIKSSTIFLKTSKTVFDRMLSGEISFDDYINNYYNSFHNIALIANIMNNNDCKKLYGIIGRDIIDYVINNENCIKIDRLSTFFDANYLKSAGNTDSLLCKEVIHFIRLNIGNSRYLSTDDYQKMNKLKTILNAYSIHFSRNTIPSSFQFGNNEYMVTDEKIDETLAYIDDNGIILCMKTFNYYLKKILKGELEYHEQLNQDKSELIETILNLKQTIKKKKENLDISDYIGIMKHR